MTSTGTLKSPADQALAEFAGREKSLPGQGLAWLEIRRRRAIDRFESLGFPTDKTENWRFTPAATLIERSFAPQAEAPRGFTPETFPLCELDAYRLVFVNGRYAPNLSRELPKGAVLGNLAALLKVEPKRLEPALARVNTGHAFTALNAAYFTDGAVLHLAKGVTLDKPVHLLFVSACEIPAASYVRVLIVAEPGSRAQIIEEHAGQGEYLTNAVTEISAGEGSNIEYYKLQRESPQAVHVAALQVRQQKNSVFAAHSIALGALMSRADVDVRLEDEGADCTLNGLYLVDGRQHVDNSTVIDHLKPHGTSRELYKGVLDGQSRAVFNGTIVVEKDAQKTSALVYNKNLLLSENGLVNTKPEFKINANDVQCRHGATIGQLSGDALFYLRSRGLSFEAARSMLVYAFASEMIDGLGIEPLRESLAEVLHKRLPELN
jgi:Fe-S cluster assembly protein SufD